MECNAVYHCTPRQVTANTFGSAVSEFTYHIIGASIAGIVTEYYHVLCESSWSYKYASVWLTSIDFFSIR